MTTVPTLFLLCGLAFPGKTTLAAALRHRLGRAVVSSDEINARRGLHGGDGMPAEEPVPVPAAVPAERWVEETLAR